MGAGAINSLRRMFHRRVCGHGGEPYHAVPAQDHHAHRGWHHRYDDRRLPRARGAIDLAGGFAAKADGTFGDISNLFLGTLVILAIVCVNRSKNPLLRMSSLIVGILVGFAVAIVMGKVNWNILSEQHTWFIMPVPFKFGFFGFDLHSFLVLSFLFLVVVIEAIGDLTATSVVSEQPVRGRVYRSRLAGGILCDGMMTSLGAIFGCFPVATFSQNNGVIQLSGVASRKVGKFCGVLFILFALFPIIVVFFQLLPVRSGARWSSFLGPSPVRVSASCCSMK